MRGFEYFRETDMRLKAALIAGALALAVAATPTVALANTPPPTKVYASNQGWSHPSVKPTWFAFTMNGGPYFNGLRWQYWGTGSAHATGTLSAINAGCAPIYLCRPHSYPVRVQLTVVKQHGSVRYFDKMTVTFYRHGAWHTQVAVFRTFCSTCTIPGWDGPNAWPYL
jgi:hypothetical protein